MHKMSKCIFLFSLVDTEIKISYLFPFSLLIVETADYPGLLVDLVKNITDINIAVQSGEFDTEVPSFNKEILVEYHLNDNVVFLT